MAGVGGENQDGVPEEDVPVMVVVVEPAGIQNLQKKMDYIRVGLFDFIKKQETAGMLHHESAELSRRG